VLLHELLAQRSVQLDARPLAALRLAVPTTLMLDALDAAVATAFSRTLAALRRAGARIEEIPLPTLGDVAGLFASGGFSAAESWAWHRNLLRDHASRYDPRVALRIWRGEHIGAADYIELHAARRAWIARMEHDMRGFDAMLGPTLPCAAPELATLLHDDEAFFAANNLLLRNPSVVNMLDGCAISLPCQLDGELPVGLMVWSTALRDDAVLDAALAIEAVLQLPRR
jgi:Asp-tRNA(Asn)/Glu-tRNA(Gln) amidotransferase A subunit family amidase